MEQGSISRSSAAGQFPARHESTKSAAVPSAMPALVVKSSVVSPLKVPQSPAWWNRERDCPGPWPCRPGQAGGRAGVSPLVWLRNWGPTVMWAWNTGHS